MNKPSLLVTRCKSILRRWGGQSEASRPLHDFSPAVQKELVDRAQLAEQEEPAVACFLSRDLWVLVTTTRLIWCNYSSIVQSLPWKDIEQSFPDDGDLLAPSAETASPTLGNPPAPPRELDFDNREDMLRSTSWVLQRHRLSIQDNKGDVHTLELDPATFNPFWKLIGVMIVTSKE